MVATIEQRISAMETLLGMLCDRLEVKPEIEFGDDGRSVSVNIGDPKFVPYVTVTPALLDFLKQERDSRNT
jgi:hypothetical protein